MNNYTFTVNGGKFHDPMDIFRSVFSQEFGTNSDFADSVSISNDDNGKSIKKTIKTTSKGGGKNKKSPKAGSDSPSSDLCYTNKKMQDKNPSRPKKPLPMAMSSKTRTVHNADGSVEKITETTLQHEDGETEIVTETTMVEDATADGNNNNAPVKKKRSTATANRIVPSQQQAEKTPRDKALAQTRKNKATLAPTTATSTNTRTVQHADGSVDTITETTIQHADGRVETKQSRSTSAIPNKSKNNKIQNGTATARPQRVLRMDAQ
jgi:hypothetical protein